MIPRRLFYAVAVAMAVLASAPAARAQSEPGATLTEILKRGYVSCGVSEAPGFAQPDGKDGWQGFDVDLCRAVAAAIFDNPAKVRFLGLGAKERVAALQSRWVDLIASGAPWTQSRDAQRVLYAGVSFYDGQGFLVRRQRSFASVQDLAKVAVCVQQGTSHELELADFFHARKTPYEPKLFASFDEAAAAYGKGECDALSGDATTLYGARAKLASPAEHDVLPELVTKAPRGPIVRQGDDQWFAIVRWALFALLDAEELQISSANADQALKSESPRMRHFLGVEGDRSANLALPGDWPYRIVKHVGNYADIFERNLGQGSPLAMERRINALWNKGGLMYAPAVR